MTTKVDKIGYNSACVGDISKILLSNGVFRVELLNDISLTSVIINSKYLCIFT